MIKIIDTTLPAITDNGYKVNPIDSFIDCLTTPLGSVIAKTDYGTNLYQLKHKPFNSLWIIDFKRCLKDACSHDPRLEFKEAIVFQNELGTGLLIFEVHIKNYIIKGTANV